MARRRRDDPKQAALREARCLNPRPEAVADAAFTAGPEFFDARDLVQVKYEMVRRVRAEGQPATKAAAASGFSRPSYYQAAAAVDAGGLAGLVPARTEAGAQAHRPGGRLRPPAPRRRPVAAQRGPGRRDRGPVRHHRAPALGGTGAGPRRRPEKRRRPRRAAVSAPAASPATSPGTSSCASRCSAGSRAAGGWAWACCTTAGSRPGWPPGTTCPPRHRPSPRARRPGRYPATASSWLRRWPRWRCPAWPRGGEPR